MKKYYHDLEPDDPFFDLLTILSTTVHPESMPDGSEELKKAAREGPDHPRMVAFKAQLTRALRGDIDELHPEAISEAAQYDEFDTDEEFLRQLWSDLYPDEPVPTRS